MASLAGPSSAVRRPLSRRRYRVHRSARRPGSRRSSPPCDRPLASHHGDPEGDPRGRRPRGHDHEPGQGLLPRDRLHEDGPGPYYLAVADGALRGAGGRPMALKRFVDGDHERAVLPEAGAGQHARLDPDRRADVPVRPDRRRDRPRRGGRPGLGRQPRLHRPEPAPRPGRGPRPSRRAAGRPRPGARASSGRRSARSRSSASEALEAVGLVGWPKTSGSRGIHINVRIEPRWTYAEVRRAALALARDVERRAPDDRDEQVVEGGAPRRLPRLQPERQGPDRRLRVLRPAAAGRPGLDAAPLGRGADVVAEDFTIATVPGALRRARRRRRGDRRGRGSLEALLELSPRHEARGPGRRAVAAELREAGRRAAARPAVAGPPAEAEYEPGRGVEGGPPPEVAAERAAAVAAGDSNGGPADRVAGDAAEGHARRLAPDADRPAQDVDPGHRDQPRGDEGGGAGGPRTLEGAPSRGRRRTSSRPTS